MPRPGVNLPRVSPGRPIEARSINRSQSEAEGQARASIGGMRAATVGGVPMWTPGVGTLRFAKTGGSGIDAMIGLTPGVADCEICLFDGVNIVPTGATEPVINWTPTDVGPNKVIVIGTIDNANSLVADSC